MTYEEYLNVADRMSIEEADAIYKSLFEQLDFNDEDITDFYEDVVTRAKKYADMRFRWSLMETQDRLAEDDDRTALHDSFLNALSKMRTVLTAKGKSAAWYDMIGDSRKRAGDFACYLVLLRSISER